MLEVIKHLFGMCGEPHFNIFHLLIGSIPGIPYIKVLLKAKLNKK